MLSAFTDLVGPASFPDTRLGRKWITGSVYKSRTPWMSTIILKANSVIQLATFLPNEEKRRTVSWKQNPSCISPSWKTLLSSAQAPSRLDESEVTSVKHRSVKYFENISSRIESDSKAAESLRSRPWTHGRSAVGIVLSVPRVSCGNRVWLPSSERLGSYDIIMIFLWWFYLLSYCTSLLTIVHCSFTRDTNEVVHFKALSQHKGFSAVGDFLWQLHHLELNTMKYDENSTILAKLKWWNDYQIQKKTSNWLWRLKAHSAHSSWFWSVVFIWTKIPVSVPKSVSQQEIDIMCSTATQARFNCMTMYFLSNSSTHVQQWFTVISSDIWKSWNRQLKRFRVQFAELNSISRFHSFHSILIFGLVEELCVMLGKSLVDHIGLTLSPPETRSRRNGCFFVLRSHCGSPVPISPSMKSWTSHVKTDGLFPVPVHDFAMMVCNAALRDPQRTSAVSSFSTFLTCPGNSTCSVSYLVWVR